MRFRKRFIVTILLPFMWGVIYAHEGMLFNVEQFDNRTGLSNSAINNLFIDHMADLGLDPYHNGTLINTIIIQEVFKLTVDNNFQNFRILLY